MRLPSNNKNPLEVEDTLANELCDAFAALGHPTKLRIFLHVLNSAGVSDTLIPTVIAIDLDLPTAVAAYSLKRLHQVFKNSNSTLQIPLILVGPCRADSHQANDK